ncbi:MAG: NUDIX domain-containing protein [Intrasporangium sp.]|uniref:NUDIX hydrolase n=1 Tax=Intrasporangium sp. TaxID=1925024 RepID=UPI0026473F7F|nr:NUDIX domain-containing protein [Intrasporangium sp.]MDN5797864.1 NUDIX domain-containing protein [Intrasporangium sp.]
MNCDPVRTFRTVPPGERPRRTRRTARVLLVDDLGRILLFSDSDPGLPGRHWWITPGGGVDPGESDLQAAVREVEEETGARITEEQLLGPTLVRQVVHGYTDVVIDQEDVFYACWVPAFEVSDAGHTAEERLTMARHRWWTRAELASTDEEVWPAAVLSMWADADARLTEARAGRSSRPPVDEGSAEESTIPV